MKILVTGGAGYIGSFMVKSLIGKGYETFVLDNLERGHRGAVDGAATFVKGDIRDLSFLNDLFKKESFEAVLHFAGYISVEESSRLPDNYYENNVTGSKNLFSVASETGRVEKFIFSSTAAVYGNPIEVPIPEDHPKNPTSPYGKTKLETEGNLSSLRKKTPSINFACLRYFNACGAALDGTVGEDHNPETHIIPLAMKAAINGQEFNLYGTDYNTPDGTCIRDYIHVLDLVEAHLMALDKLEKDKGEYYYNVGTGKGYSNRQVLDTIEKISDRKINIKMAGRREGDADQLVADPSKINSELGFKPRYSDLETIIKSAWLWHSKSSK